MERPMLFCAFCCCLVSVAGFLSTWALFAVSMILALTLAVFIIKGMGGDMIFALLMAIVMTVCSFGTLKTAKRLERFSGRQITATAVFCENVYKSESYYRSEIEVLDGNLLKKGTKLSVFHKPMNIDPGRIIKAKIKLNAVPKEYKAQNYSKEIFLNGSMSDIVVLKEKDPVLSAAHGIRKYIKTAVFKNCGYREAATLCALIFGDKSYFTDEFYSNVKGAGVAHVMVVSGMHLSILVMFFVKLTEKMFYHPLLKALIIFLVVIILCAVCGFTMSILRAGVTYVILALSLVVGRPYSPDNALGGAVSLILITSPFAILNVGFLLSATSTFGILSVALPVTEYVKSRNLIKTRPLYSLFSGVVITLSAMILTLPVTIYVFGYVSAVAVITNLLISFAVTACLSVSVAAIIINLLFPAAAVPLFAVAEILAKYINGVIDFLGSKSFSVVAVPHFGAYIAFIFVVMLLWGLLACKKRIDVLKLERMNEKIKNDGRVRKNAGGLRIES
ncbi:MAG: ComEC/Rec2 family competence protein [Acutalibacteraceae bacterium]|jgi:ComEC/Rec2-related protein